MKKEAKSILKPYGHTDVLLYYSLVSRYLKNFLKGKELAGKIWLPKGIPFFIRRGSNMTPLYAEEMKNVDEKMLKMRADMNLDKAKGKISKVQEKIWSYFVPSKLIDFFYATNSEHPGKPIDRIFIDLDRGNGTSEDDARIVAQELIKAIKSDKELKKVMKFKIFIMWTGSSFHVYLLMPKKYPHSFYEKYFKYSKDAPLSSFIGKWALKIDKKIGRKVKVSGGHEKIAGAIILDPSQTPSGKLARAPFSLHMKNALETNGVAVPVSEKELSDKNLIKKLKAYTPESVLKNIKQLARNIPK
jgi:hypothetical protein